MEPRQERLVKYIQELHRRDKQGPDAFQIHSASAFIDPVVMRHIRPFGQSQAERFGLRAFGNIPPVDMARGADITLSLPPGSARGDQSRAQSKIETSKGPIAVVEPQAGTALTDEAAAAFERALENKQLSNEDLLQLESIVLPALRPVYDVQNETYSNLPGVWDAFNLKRGQIEPLIRGIGRLQLSGHPSYTLVGTGFVCGPNAVITNRHVAQIFVEGVQSGYQLSFQLGVSCAMDLLAEVGSASTLMLDISRPVSISTAWDIALLRVEGLPQGVEPLPLARSEPAGIVGGMAAVIGYPSYDPNESFVDQANIFRSVFDRKRLQPGKLNGRATILSFGKNVSAIAHDCSTLGGNSGSALVSADLAQVVGIHFAGTTHVSNYAIPVWELANDPAFAENTFSFV